MKTNFASGDQFATPRPAALYAIIRGTGKVWGERGRRESVSRSNCDFGGRLVDGGWLKEGKRKRGRERRIRTPDCKNAIKSFGITDNKQSYNWRVNTHKQTHPWMSACAHSTGYSNQTDRSEKLLWWCRQEQDIQVGCWIRNEGYGNWV